MQYAIIKNGEILYITDNIPTKQVYFSQKEMDKILQDEAIKIASMTTEELFNYQEPSNVKIQGIDYDEAIEYSFSGKPVLQNGQIIEDNSEKIARKQEIKKQLGELSIIRNGMVILVEDTTDIDAQITALKGEYASIIV